MSAETKSRKEIKAEYRERKSEMGVYQIRNLKNGKVFVGSTTTLGTIWNSQRFRLEAASHQNAELQADWNALGPEAFEFSIVHTLEPLADSAMNVRDELRALEEMVIADFRPFGDRGYHRPKP